MLTKNQIKLIRSLHQKKHRDTLGLFIAEGEKIVDELLTSNYEILWLIALDSWDASLMQPTHVVEETVLQQISALQTPNKVLAVIKKKEEAPSILKEDLYLYLDQIKDPGNMGTIIRSAEWFGLKNIFCAASCVDIYNPKLVQASMGSIFRMHCHTMSLESLITATTPQKIYGAVIGGQDISTISFIKNAILIIGSESHGISESNSKLIQENITIASLGKAESLNAAIASAVLMYEITRQFSK